MMNAENKELQLHLHVVPALLIYEIGRHVFVTTKWNTGNGSSCFVDIIRQTVHMHIFMNRMNIVWFHADGTYFLYIMERFLFLFLSFKCCFHFFSFLELLVAVLL